MLFYTPEFLVFSIVLLAAVGLANRGTPRKVVLLAASYVFYMWWNPAFILLIIFSTAVDYVVGRRMGGDISARRRRVYLGISLAANLGLLGWFKYAGFFQANAMACARLLGYDVSWSALNVTLPVGISFYTFQTMSYSIDVYRGRLRACHNPVDFALFVAFFPQLVAGPIVRASAFLPQLRVERALCFDLRGFFLILRGLAKKVIIADNIALFADRVFADVAPWPSIVIWLAAICFYVQIYCDFSGYSDIAIGIARILGYHLPWNFNRPYFATSPQDFWRRWHISLSTWFRDYLYIPLGGSRHGRLKTARNLMTTMLLAGLWHGAHWNFVLWGCLHGVALMAQRFGPSMIPPSRGRSSIVLTRMRTTLCWAMMQYWVLLTWITFRVTDSREMGRALAKFVLFDFDFNLANIGLGNASLFSTIVVVTAFLVAHAFSALHGGLDVRLARCPMWIVAAVCVVAGFVFYYFWPVSDTPFIYFQF